MVHRISREDHSSHAQKVQTLFIDDLDGGEADGIVRFGLDGTEYEIDLNAEHAQQLRDALARYVSAARRVGRAGQPARSGRRAPANGLDTTEVREWPRPKASTSKIVDECLLRPIRHGSSEARQGVLSRLMLYTRVSRFLAGGLSVIAVMPRWPGVPSSGGPSGLR